MTIGTLDFRTGVRTRERKIRPFMVKCFVVQIHYLGLTSLVFGMAITASMITDTPVITTLAPYIFCNVLVVVTAQAKLVLPTSLKRLVASLAFMLKLGMTLNHVARGNHGVERIHVRLKRYCRNKQNQSHPRGTHSTGYPIILSASTCALLIRE